MIATNLIDGAMPSIDVLGSHVGECVEDGADERAIDCCTKQQFTGRLQKTNRRTHAHLSYLSYITQMTRTTNFYSKIVLTVRIAKFGTSKGLLPPIALKLRFTHS